MKHYGDITKIHGDQVEPVDIITGGSPCQDLSVAGKRAGLDGERSGLFMEQIRIVKEMRDNDVRSFGRTGRFVRPRYMVWENVPGAFSSNGGKDFQAVLTEIARVAEPECPDVPMPEKNKWRKAGCVYGDMGQWSIAWRVHDAQFWGVPQRRKRIALVADFGGMSAPEILFERKSLSGDSDPCGQERKTTPGTTADRVGVPVCYGISSYESNSMKSGNPYSGVYKSVLCCGTSWDGSDISTTLTSKNAGGNQRMPDKDNFNAVVSYGLDRAAYNQGKNAQFDFSVEKEKIGAQVAKEPGAVCTAVDVRNSNEDENVNGALQGEAWKNHNSNNVLRQNGTVRRLTPLECERLQGFPDGWTDIGEWTDSKGKRHKDADSPRYKALGNSIALPFWAWLARRICAQYERPMTMASLFDGIGGFPLVFSRAGCIPVWASEIEEFPIAVTKIRFPERSEPNA